MKNKILSVLSMLCFTLGIHAASTHLTVELKSGEMYSFLLTTKPIITFNETNLIVNGNAETSYEINDVKNFHFTEEEISGEKVVPKYNLHIISVDNATIKIENANPNSLVSLYSVPGVTFSTILTDNEGTALISIPQSKGVYVIIVNEKSFKIIKK